MGMAHDMPCDGGPAPRKPEREELRGLGRGLSCEGACCLAVGSFAARAAWPSWRTAAGRAGPSELPSEGRVLGARVLFPAHGFREKQPGGRQQVRALGVAEAIGVTPTAPVVGTDSAETAPDATVCAAEEAPGRLLRPDCPGR